MPIRRFNISKTFLISAQWRLSMGPAYSRRVNFCTRNLNSVDLSSPILAQQYNNSQIPRTMGTMRRLKRYKTGVNECLHTTYTTISRTMAAKLRPASGGHCTYLVSIIGITISEKLSRQQTEQNSIRLLLYTGPSNFLESRWKYRSQEDKVGRFVLWIISRLCFLRICVRDGLKSSFSCLR